MNKDLILLRYNERIKEIEYSNYFFGKNSFGIDWWRNFKKGWGI